jgi:hypothetical protein
MCEFDTMSDTEEVIDVIYKSLRQAIISVDSLMPCATSCGLVGRLSDLRGIYEGTYRARQFMSLMKRFMSEVADGEIRVKLETVLNS